MSSNNYRQREPTQAGRSTPQQNNENRKPLAQVQQRYKETVNVVENIKGVKQIGSVWDDFKKFIDKGNVIDLAVAIIMGASLTSIVQSIVNDILAPVIGLAVGDNLANSFYVLACPKDSNGIRLNACPKSTAAFNYNTVKDAQTAGAVTWNYGAFIQAVINFFIVSLIVYFIVKMYTAVFRRKKAVKTKKDCGYCCNEIPIKARICGFCCSQLDFEA
jgi:large conductance mechanosensitive channel